MTRRSKVRLVSAAFGLVLGFIVAAQEPVDNCASLLGSLSVELRYARTLAPAARTTFICPRDTRALLGASKQRIVNSLGPPDVTATGGHDGAATSWLYFFGPRPDASYPPGVPELRFEFDALQVVNNVHCQRTR